MNRNRKKNLPLIWQEKLKSHLLEIGSKYEEISANDFEHNLKITFEDNSYAFFYFAFYIIDENLKEVAVFTEHCGYHVFYLPEILLELTDWEGNIIKTDDYRTE